MQISGYRSYNTGETWPPFEAFPDSVRVRYSSGGLPANHSDRLYVGGVTLDLSNYLTVGTLAATVSDGAATHVLLTGLSPGRQYCVLGVRYDGGSPTTTISNQEVVGTSRTYLPVVAATANMEADWTAESLFQWFNIDPAAAWLHCSQQNDATLGDFVRIVNSIAGFNSLGYAIFEGIKQVSPRYDFTLEIPIRHNIETIGTNNNLGLSEQQFFAGLNSGSHHLATFEFYRAHACGFGNEEAYEIDHERADDNVATSSATRFDGTLWGTFRAREPDSWGGSAADGTTWSLRPAAAHAAYDDWQTPANAVATLKFVYAAATKKLTIYKNNVILTEMGPEIEYDYPLAKRERINNYHNPLPITPTLRLQHLVYGNNACIDIGQIKLQTNAPYAYAAWGACGHHGSSWGAVGDTGLYWWDAGGHTLTNFRFFANFLGNATRFKATDFRGLTVPPVTPSIVDPTDFIFHGTSYTYPTEMISGQTPIALVPPGHKAVKYAFQGIQRYGTIEGRLLDGQGAPLSTWQTIDGPFNTALLDANENAAMEVRAEIRIQHDGSTVPNTETPPMFLGFEVYFESVTSTPGLTIDTPGDNALFLTGTRNESNTIVGVSGATFGQATYPTATTWILPISGLSVGDNTIVVEAEGSAGATTQQQTIVSVSPIKTLAGLFGGTLKTLSGQPAGTLRRRIGGTWQ